MTIYMAEDRVEELEQNIALATFMGNREEKIAEWEEELDNLNRQIKKWYDRHATNQ